MRFRRGEGSDAGDRGRAALENTTSWPAEHSAVVMTVVLLVLGAVLLGNGIGELR